MYFKYALMLSPSYDNGKKEYFVQIIIKIQMNILVMNFKKI